MNRIFIAALASMCLASCAQTFESSPEFAKIILEKTTADCSNQGGVKNYKVSHYETNNQNYDRRVKLETTCMSGAVVYNSFLTPNKRLDLP